MREILFRGFHPCEKGKITINVDGKKIMGKWVEGNFLVFHHTTTDYYIQEQNVHFRSFAVITETVGQYTGLIDKNGNKIFDGDILKVLTRWKKAENKTEPINEYDDKIGITEWSVEHTSHYCEGSTYSIYGKDRRFHKPLTQSMIYNAEAVIIGNIHENKEMLNETSNTI